MKEEGVLNVCSIGGGPGSEVLGLAKWLERNSSEPVELNALVTDRFVEWKKTWSTLSDQINIAVSLGPRRNEMGNSLVVGGDFTQVDAKYLTHMDRVRRRGQFDLYIGSYVLSHIFSQTDLHSFEKSMAKVVADAGNHSRFLFVDRAASADMWKMPVRKLADMARLELSEFLQVPPVKRDSKENEKDLGLLYSTIGDLNRPSPDAFWVTGIKV